MSRRDESNGGHQFGGARLPKELGSWPRLGVFRCRKPASGRQPCRAAPWFAKKLCYRPTARQRIGLATLLIVPKPTGSGQVHWLFGSLAPPMSPYLYFVPSGRESSVRQNGQRELKSRAAIIVRKGFQTSAMSFNNRPANRKPHAETVRFGCIEGSKELGQAGGK